MPNVIRLLTRRNGDISRSEPETGVSTAPAGILASGAQLVHTAKDLTRQFDAIESAIDTIGDVETRTRLKKSIKLSQNALLKAMLVLSQQIQKIGNQLGA
jgi:hypothetical protein